MNEQRLFIGSRIRRLRRDRGLSQTAMAKALDISPSYLNLLERNQRPVTVAVLLRLARAYEVDVVSLASTPPSHTSVEHLTEIFADSMFADLSIPRYETVEVATHTPAIADAISRLYTAFRDLRALPEFPGDGDVRSVLTPESWVRDYIQAQRNHFPDLEEWAESVSGAMRDSLSLAEPLRARLKDAWGITVRVAPPSELADASQHYDKDRRQLLLSSLLRNENRVFGLAYQLSLVEFGHVIDQLVEAAAPPDSGSRSLLHMSLANYAASAIMMPYQRFLASAEAHRYSIDALCGEYGANVEQVAHRLTTLGRPGAKGVPFFMLRVDPAGNISKRYAGENFPFSRFGGTCPRWNLHAAFQNANQTISQVIETPDGERFFTIARTIERPIRADLTSAGVLALGLGCDLRHAPRISYADGIDLANPPVTEVGPACAICPRMQCPQRATAPAGRRLAVQEHRKTISPYPFVP